ncbi:hypothetical protein DYU11_11160 [Fibrisoma montanum]|uniref:Lipoprotein n=1 Tax=Fibrisoma montanum TaxID=2305895 RepID=A0A418MCH7_9BACT|nr:hypothetical protein [Fibrisoma montanum]RIV24084.1 hypothetical protein DYU11_11160 [Fibrisoma montanum]
MRRLLMISVLACYVLTACSSGQAALRRHKFDLAVRKASQRLQQPRGWGKRGHTLAPQVLRTAFEQGYQQHQSEIRRLSSPAAQIPFRWEPVYEQYRLLQALTDNARSCTACADWLALYPATYDDRQRETRELAAADRYEVAEQAFAFREENRLAAKDAYLNYRKAMEWVPDYRQARGKAEDALALAILRVVVEPFSPSPELDRDDQADLQRLVFREIGRQTAPSEFVRLYSPDEGDAAFGWPIHQAVQMVVTRYRPYDERVSSASTTVYSDKEYKVGEKKINDSTKVDIKEKVKGTLTTYRKEICARLEVSVRAIDTETGQVLWEEPVSESEIWATEWQKFDGDERALNGQSLKTADFFEPSRWSLFREIRDDMASSVAYLLRRRYSRDQ